MSDTIKKNPQQATREGVQQVREAVNATIESGERATRDTARRAEDVLTSSTESAREIGSHMADTMVRTADAAVDITQRAAEQQREAVWQGVRAAAGMNSKLAEASYNGGHRALEAATRAADIYRETGSTTAEHAQALFAAGMQLARGVLDFQHAWLEQMQLAAVRTTHKPHEVLRCASLEELAEFQRDMYIDWMNEAVRASSALLQLSGRIAQDAMRPLQQRSPLVRA